MGDGHHVHKNVLITGRRSFEFSDIAVELKEHGKQLVFELSRRGGSKAKVLEHIKVDGVVGHNARLVVGLKHISPNRWCILMIFRSNMHPPLRSGYVKNEYPKIALPQVGPRTRGS